MIEERIQKILARAGYGSRRACEKLIEAGRVRVNGKIVSLGDKAVAGKDEIRLDGRPIKTEPGFEYYAVYKPRGVLSAVSNQYGLTNVVELVETDTPLHPVGRLDLDSEGLVLLTNDGELTNRLSHPRYGHEKEYRVLVAKQPDSNQLNTWSRGVVLEDGYKTAPVTVRLEKTHGKGAWLNVTMKEGRKRQIRETAQQVGLPVVKLIRVRISTLRLGSLKPNKWRALTENEILALKGEKTSGGRSMQKKPKRKPYNRK